jgi:hypothetical protein
MGKQNHFVKTNIQKEWTLADATKCDWDEDIESSLWWITWMGLNPSTCGVVSSIL